MTAEAPWQCKLEYSTDKMVGKNKVLIAGGTEHSQFQPSVRRVMIALGILAGLAASDGTRRHQRSFIWV